MTEQGLEELILLLKKDKRFLQELYVVQNNLCITGYLLKGKKHLYGFFPYSKNNEYWLDWGLAFKTFSNNYDLLGMTGKDKKTTFKEIDDLLNSEI